MALFFSEYIEGSSNNKALEIYNGTGAAIDLTAGNYVVQFYFNSSTTAGLTIPLTGTVAAGDVYVLSQSSANATILAQADQTNGAGWFNGDDAIVLRQGGATGTILDSIGQIGFDPGTEWGTGLTSTADNTLRRKSITSGDTNPSDAFDPSVEWEGFATDTFDGLGSYTTTNPGGGDSTLREIYEIQGSGASSPLVGQNVTIEAVVVGDFQGSSGLDGFYVQEAVGDGNAATSDGIFVFAPNSIDVSVGQTVRLTGTVGENFNQTQISNISGLSVVGSDAIAPTIIDLPVNATTDLERYEGMLVTFPETLTVTENFNLGRFGEVLLSSEERLFNPTNFIDPTDIPSAETENDENNIAAVTAQQNANNLRQILLDDGSNTQNPATVPYLNENGTLRVGSTVTNLTGVLGFGFGSYRLQPTSTPNFVDSNPRTAAPENVGGNVKVASFNVLNYFNGDGIGGGFPTSRGADTLAEFERQSAKIVSAIAALNADVVGLIEIENDGDGTNSAIAELVERLNTFLGTAVYDYIRDPATGTGTDEIKVAFIYKPGTVTPVGASLSDPEAIYNRLPVAQTFELNSNGETFTPVINHFKSKGGTATGSDADQGDGQGAFNFTRVQQAEALLGFVNQLKTSTGDSDILVLGDLNAYGEEDPIDVLRNGGLIDELGKYIQNPYSYVFEGQSGRLDHALSTSSLSTQITGATEWHINADEPRILDYNQEFNPPGLYQPTPYRSSDHDPVLVGAELASILNVVNGGNGEDTLTGTSGRDELNGDNGRDTLLGGNGRDILNGGNGDDLLNGGQGQDTLIGGSGSDRYLLAAGAGADTLQNFKDTTDFLALSGGLTFGQLTITGNSNNTLIRVTQTNELLATLNNVQANTITEVDFVTI
ncbi:ExeM/NucH family extracellular endonuclease [Nostoc sp. FACHB-152]|uniref:ExeM/NucH family extracellular endonuclease n=1 Tax=unclassified Nostoc TaxID=2593658 RepID=UPI0016857F30|nr:MULTISPECIES: ExeM/NucH family extracellular endonuclease [unclassified Nostoc]MBD2451355.1 ExeM/NucH family extracellular endonuclease [Nostoc sp. FACHB-152]MBD2472036.1 ExeM/NucH family extracellular endonuclease [Nostoc sp. FACHB-145]